MKKSFVNELWEDAIMFLDVKDSYQTFKNAVDFDIFIPLVMIISVYLALRSIFVLIPVIAPFKLVVWVVENKRRRVVL